jgi:hypothetical protein
VGITEDPLVQIICVGLKAGVAVHATGDGTPGFNVGELIAEIAVKEYVPAGVADGPNPPDAS